MGGFSKPPNVLQVRIDEPGGGATHVRLLIDLMQPSSGQTQVAIPKPWTQRATRWLRIHQFIAEAARNRDLLHAHGIRAAFHCISVSLIHRIPLVVTVHGLHSIRRARRGDPLPKLVTRWVLSRAATIFVLGPDDMRLLAKTGMAPRDRTLELPPLFEVPVVRDRRESRLALGIPADAFVVLWVGRFEAEKDPLTFAKAMIRLGPDGIWGVMAGEGPLFEEVRAAASSGDANLVCPGWLNDLSMAYAGADLYVNCSLWETMPIAALEAQAAKLPLILSRAPGNHDLLKRGLGTGFATGDDEDLARLIRVLSRKRGERSRCRDGTAFCSPTHNEVSKVAFCSPTHNEVSKVVSETYRRVARR